ncbi:helix-turn-helix domain-containing protein [Mycolicibacterium hodleri]|uniref:XRE family transcriptional regulator n=1 Tax=Mycolicibacterium hodleri TaxID=49897 RepID=A0A502DRP0_9MYCO|nr:helix-turn-helix transcriptional regulator [Mycolicibacterium hodleri]TPG28105.1 XRE family transcriptional regulator [Mycolicibacterium hodleri]
MAVKTATAKKTAAPKKAAKKAPAAAKKAPTSSGGRVDYRTARAQRQAALTGAQRQTYEQAYHDAGRAMDLAELVYTARTEAGLTQTQLAAAMSTSQSAVAAWENGARTPGIDALERLAAACGKRLRIAITAA